LGLHTGGHAESRYARAAAWDGTNIVAIGMHTYFGADGLRTWEPLVWISTDLGTTWASVPAPTAAGYSPIDVQKIFQWGGKYTIFGDGRPTSGAYVPLAWSSTDGRSWSLLPSDNSVYTTNAATAMSGDGVHALLRCNSGFAMGIGTLSDRAALWTYSNLGAWQRIATTAFDADERNALYGVDECGDPHVLVGRAWVAPGYYAAAAWTYGSSP
jgi:hypothetical protein